VNVPPSVWLLALVPILAACAAKDIIGGANRLVNGDDDKQQGINIYVGAQEREYSRVGPQEQGKSREYGPQNDYRSDGQSNGGYGGEERGDEFPPQRVGFLACLQNFQHRGGSESAVAELGRRCGAPCGMRPFSDIRSDQQSQSDSMDIFTIQLRADRCYRFFAAGGNGIDDLDAYLADENGDILVRDVMDDKLPVIGPDGPFCPSRSGRYKYAISVAKGIGTYHFQVWEGRR